MYHSNSNTGLPQFFLMFNALKYRQFSILFCSHVFQTLIKHKHVYGSSAHYGPDVRILQFEKFSTVSKPLFLLRLASEPRTLFRNLGHSKFFRLNLFKASSLIIADKPYYEYANDALALTGNRT